LQSFVRTSQKDFHFNPSRGIKSSNEIKILEEEEELREA
jgi:hypothetical protein